MFNVGVAELFVILLLALLVFGPNKLPEIARGLGRAIRMFQQETDKATRTFKEAFEDPATKQRVGVIDRPDPLPAEIDEPADPAPDGTEGAAAAADELLDPAARLLEDT